MAIVLIAAAAMMIVVVIFPPSRTDLERSELIGHSHAQQQSSADRLPDGSPIRTVLRVIQSLTPGANVLPLDENGSGCKLEDERRPGQHYALQGQNVGRPRDQRPTAATVMITMLNNGTIDGQLYLASLVVKMLSHFIRSTQTDSLKLIYGGGRPI